jgi:AraC family transcriptional regulator
MPNRRTGIAVSSSLAVISRGMNEGAQPRLLHEAESAYMPTQAPDNQGRICSILDGDLRPSPGVLLFSSFKSGWSGFLFERRQIVEVGKATTLVCPFPHAFLVASGSLTFVYRAGSTLRRVLAAPGSTTIWPSDYEVQSVSWTGECELLALEMNLAVLQQVVGSGVRPRVDQLTPQLAIKDRQLAALIRSIEVETMSGCPAGSLYGQALSLALAAYVAGRNSTGARSGGSQAGRLSPRLVSRVRDYIRANLGNRLSVTALAEIVNLSPSYFSEVFKNSIGVAPHEYVLRERIREAATLLTKGDTPVAQVAQMLGFASQSHFADVFRRATAMSPKQYRGARRQAASDLRQFSEVRRLF